MPQPDASPGQEDPRRGVSGGVCVCVCVCRCVPVARVCPHQRVPSESRGTIATSSRQGGGTVAAARAAGLGGTGSSIQTRGHCGSLHAARRERAARAKPTQRWSQSLSCFHLFTLFYSPHQGRIRIPPCLLGRDTCPPARTPAGSPELP